MAQPEPGSDAPPPRTWRLLDAAGRPYVSPVPGQLGGHRRGRRYGRLDCPAARRALVRGGYVRGRVFFADEATAIAAGYRPCAVCLPAAYRAWRAGRLTPAAPAARAGPWNGVEPMSTMKPQSTAGGRPEQDGAAGAAAPAALDLQDAAAGVIVGPDGLARTPWAVSHPLLTAYYDTEWGVPVHTEQGLFERLSLEAFQAGLSWLTILKKRPALREAFFAFDPERVAALTDAEIEGLLANPALVRNRAKLVATRANAAATLCLRREGGLPALVWSFAPAASPAPRTMAEVPAQSPESAALAAALRRHGFRFVGPTTMYALMAAVGMVDLHLVGSHRRGIATRLASPATDRPGHPTRIAGA